MRISRPRRASLQRANDKVALIAEPDPETPLSEAFAAVKAEIAAIYRGHREHKTATRAELDVTFRRAVNRLAERQERLLAVALPRVVELANNTLGLKLPQPPPPVADDAIDRLLSAQDSDNVARAVIAALRPQHDDAKAAEWELKQLEAAIAEQINAAAGSTASSVRDLAVKQLRETFYPASSASLPAHGPISESQAASDFDKRMGEYIKAVKSKRAANLGFSPAEESFVRYKLALINKTDWMGPVPEHPYAAVKREKEEATVLARRLRDTVQDNVKKVAELGERIRAGTVDLSKLTMYATEHARHHLADPIVAAYEKGYMASGMDLAKLKEDWSKAARAKAVLLTFEDKQTHTDVVLSTTGASTERVIAFKLYQDRQRFEASGQVPSSSGQPRQLFRHRETHAEYVQDAADLFVRRFVLRCLNAYDNPGFVGVDIKADPRKKKGTGTDIGKTWAEIAETLPQGTRTSIDEELWKHQREKQLQGGSPFVSATTTKHPIFGSTGKYFEDPTGVAMLDLAKIAQARVVDTHQPEAYKRITGRDAPDPDLPFREKDPDVEKNAAVRDAMRTRELAIIGSVPQEAIVGVEAETAEGRTQYGYDTTRRRWRDPGDLHAEFLEYMRQRRLKEIDEI